MEINKVIDILAENPSIHTEDELIKIHNKAIDVINRLVSENGTLEDRIVDFSKSVSKLEKKNRDIGKRNKKSGGDW